jgi:hypothetical protein
MNASEIKKAEKKADLALCKLQDLFYLNITSKITSRLNAACDAVRELLNEIENTSPDGK